ncbi:uncharacterized protein NH340_JMT04170 [Sarcoptes scabiei]|nr:uncharacterized protein NH340_JMT04170 [Sarcoptes scabiei]
MSSHSNSLEQLCSCLLQTLSPDLNVRKPAEKFVESCERQPGFSQNLLQILQKNDIDPTVKLCASIAYKNLIKKYWAPEDDADKQIINLNDRNYSKSIILALMLSGDAKIQKQLSEAVSLIGQKDFPNDWPNLLQDMMVKLDESCKNYNFHVINGILQTLTSLFKRYQYETKSERLWLEIKFVLDTFAKTFTDLFLWIVKLIPDHLSNAQNIKIILHSLLYCAEIFCSLNAQDLAEFFEDNINVWMTNFLQLLQINVKVLDNDSTDEPGVVEQLKTQICDNITIFADIYSEEFDPYLPGFINQIWSLLDTLSNQVKYDQLVSAAIKFLQVVCERGLHKDIFSKEEILHQMCSRVIIPNMEFRECEEELFEDNPEEYIRRDVEGADVQTRRRSSCELVKALAKHFEKQMSEVFSEYIQKMLMNFSQNNQGNWKSKNAAIYLVTSLVIKGGSVRLGTTSTSDLINISAFFNNVIKSDLERLNLNELPVLKADALKYIIVFRNQLSVNEILVPIFPQLIRHLSSNIVVIHSYSAICIDKILALRDPSDQHKTLIKLENINPYAIQLLEGLFGIWRFPGSEENEYSAKAILRVFVLLKDQLLPYFEVLLPKIIEKLTLVSKNPSKPHFNHYLFEILGITIQIACTKNIRAVGGFETLLFPIFQTILVQDVQEFTPYVFQILALLLEQHTIGQVPPPYMELFPFLLIPMLWERQANFEPLTRLIKSYVKNCSREIVSIGKLEPLLGVFQKLIASKANDHLGFIILNHLIIYSDSGAIAPNLMNQIFILLFQRLSHSKTSKFVSSLLVFFNLFVYKFGPKPFYDLVETLQSKMFNMVLVKLFIADARKVSGVHERKIICIGVTKILTELDFFLQPDLAELWPALMEVLVAVHELRQEDPDQQDDLVDPIDLPNEYQATYSRLVYATSKQMDLIPEISDSKLFLAKKIEELSKRFPKELSKLISLLSMEPKKFLENYLATYNVKIF